MGHIKSILPQSGGVSPVDNDTVALFHYDQHAKDAVAGLNHIGNRRALDFKTTQDRVVVPALLVNTEFTISCWFYCDSLRETEYSLVGQYDGSGGRTLFTINENAGKKLRAFLGGNQFFGTTNIQSHAWYHAAWVKKTDGSGILYLNGEEDGSGMNNNNPAPNVDFQIGNAQTNRFFDGKMSNVMVFNRALGPKEVKDNMNGILSHSSASLMGYWKLDENEGQIVYDHSPVGNDGIINGCSWSNGQAQYSLNNDGHPRGEVRVKEATENLLPTVDLANTSAWGHRNCTVAKTNEVTNIGVHDVFKAVPSGTDAAIFWGASVFQAKTYTMSLWMRAPQGQQYEVGWTISSSQGGSLSSENKIMVTEQWQRFVLTQTFTAETTSYLHLVGGWGTWSTGKDIYLTKPQVEAKPYVTEFTPAKRSERKSYGSGVLVEEGTVNLIPNTAINSLPTVGNEWGTYDANAQYNSNTSFSIGTVASVVDNIVTLEAVDHPIYTYDVLNADTAGGGVAAGTEYFIKKHSANSFSLHSYDSSQDGSKGMGVHDSVNNDVRVAVDLVNFPTMWHQNAHRPNGGLVKEVIPNGFSHKGRVHDCLRMYTNFREPDNALYGYLAYGVNPPVVAGSTYTFSFYYRAVTSESIGKSIGLSLHTSGSNWSAGAFTLEEEWKRHAGTATAPTSGGTSMYLNAGHGVVWEISEIQVEEKSFATSFTDGSRVEGHLVYPVKISNPATISFWLKPMVPDDFSSHVNFVVGQKPYNDNLLMWKRNTENYYRIRVSNPDIVIPEGDISFGEWSHVVMVFDKSETRAYVNGDLKGVSGVLNPLSALTIGYADGHKPSQNMFDELRIDKVARTESEIQAWYHQGRNGW